MKIVNKIAPKVYAIDQIGSLLGKRPFSTIESLTESLVT